MGNCVTSSLSRELEHRFSEGEQETMVASNTSSPGIHAELQSSHVHCGPPVNPTSVGPLPANLDSIKQSFSKPMNLVLSAPRDDQEGQADISAQSPSTPSPSKAKLAKKVTFAEDLVQTPTSKQPASLQEAGRERSPTARKQESHHSLILEEANMRSQREELTEGLSASLLEEGKEPHDRIVKKEVDAGKVRVKVVISKKQLSELVLPSATSPVIRLGKEDGDGFVQRMVAATLLPHLIATSAQEKYSAKSGQPWRPSLDGIPEAYTLRKDCSYNLSNSLCSSHMGSRLAPPCL